VPSTRITRALRGSKRRNSPESVCRAISASVIYQNLEGPIVGDKIATGIGVRNIQLNRLGIVPALLQARGDGLNFPERASHQRHLCTRLGQRNGGGHAKSAAGTGDQRWATIEAKRRHDRKTLLLKVLVAIHPVTIVHDSTQSPQAAQDPKDKMRLPADDWLNPSRFVRERNQFRRNIRNNCSNDP